MIKMKEAKRQPNVNWGKLILLLSSFFLSVLVSLCVIQMFYKPTPIYAGWRSYAPKEELNQLGFRGQPIVYSDNDFVVLLLGDSQVEALTSCSFDQLPEKELEYQLNSMMKGKRVKVFSLGCSGYGQDQQFLVLQEYYRRYRADMVLLWLTPGNDVWNNVFPTHMPRNGKPKPTFWLEDGQLKGPSEQMGDQIGYHPIKIIMILGRIFMDRDGYWEHYLPEPYKPMLEYNEEYSRDWQNNWDSNIGLMRSENLESEKSHLSIILTPRSRRTLYGLDLTHMLLKKIENLVELNSGDFFIFVVDQAHVDTQISIIKNENSQKFNNHIVKQNKNEENTIVYLLNGKFYYTSNKQFRDNIDYIVRGMKYLFVPREVKNWRVSETDGHLNIETTNQVMKSLAINVKSIILY